MSKTLIRNTTERDIHLNSPLGAAIIPGGRFEGDKVAPGEAAVDTELVEAAMNSPVVQSYFTDGVLVAVDAPKAAKPK